MEMSVYNQPEVTRGEYFVFEAFLPQYSLLYFSIPQVVNLGYIKLIVNNTVQTFNENGPISVLVVETYPHLVHAPHGLNPK